MRLQVVNAFRSSPKSDTPWEHRTERAPGQVWREHERT